MAVIKGGYEIVKRAMLKELMKRGDDGIMLTLPKNEIVDLNTKITMDRLIKAGVDPESLTSPEQVINILESINNQMFKNIKAISADSAEGKKITDKLFGKKGEVVDLKGKKIDTSQGIMGGKSVKELMDSGEVTKGTVSKKNNKVVEREMFSEANERFNKTDIITDTVTKITSMEPVAALKEANKIVGRKGIYKNLTEEQSQKILKDTDDWIFQRDPADRYDYKNNRPFRDDPNFDPDDPDYNPDDYAKGGRAGYAVGNQVTPQVDERMNLDYNTLVDQNTAQRATQAQNRNLGNLYNKQGIMDAQSKYIDQAVASAPTLREKLNQTESLMSGSGFVSDLRHKTAAAQLRDTLGGGITGQVAANVLGGIREIPQLLTGDFKGVGEDLKANFQGARDIPVGLTPQESYDYLIAQQQVDPGVVDPTVDQNKMRYRPGFENKRLSGGELFVDAIPDFDKFGNYTGDDQLIKDYAAAGRGTASSQLVKLPENHPYAVSGAGYYEYDGTSFSKTADANMTPEYEKFIRSNYNLASGGRAGYYTGGMIDVEPNLSDIGHGSDSLMARTRLVSPDGQATTSTGLNYLLAEDNDNIRVPYSAGGGGRRAFLKLMAMLGGGIAGLKSGIIGFGGKKEGIRQATKNIIKTDNVPGKPEWFDTLVTKVINEGDDVTKKFATKEREIVHSKNLDDGTTVRVTQDIDEGAIRVEYDSADNVFEETVQLQYKKPLPDEVNPNPKAEFDVAESGPVGRRYGPDDFEIEVDEVGGSSISDLDSDVSKLKEYATGQKSTMKEIVQNKKRKDKAKNITDDQEAQMDSIIKRQGEGGEDYESADYDFATGGRVGFSGGNLAKFLAGKKITGSSRTFLEKVFGKESFENMIRNDPEMHRGLLEVVEMFRKRDKEGLKMYMQKFLPHMDDATVEDFIIGSGGTEGIQGQLIRLGSGRDYAGKMEMIKNLDNRKKLDSLNVTEEMIRKPNADGGRIGLFLGGGLTPGKSLLKNMLKFMNYGSSTNKSSAEILKMLNPKQFQKLLNDPRYMGKVTPEAPQGLDKIIRDMVETTKKDRSDMVGDIISTSRRVKKADDEITKYKNSLIKQMTDRGMDMETAVEFAENMGKEMIKASGRRPTPLVTDQGLLELENIQKNLLTKGRKLQAQGGLTTMLGE